MKRNDWKKNNTPQNLAQILCLAVVLSQTSGLIQITLPPDVTLLAWLTKAGGLVRWLFPEEKQNNRPSSRECVFKPLKALGQKKQHLVFSPSTCPGLLMALMRKVYGTEEGHPGTEAQGEELGKTPQSSAKLWRNQVSPSWLRGVGVSKYQEEDFTNKVRSAPASGLSWRTLPRKDFLCHLSYGTSPPLDHHALPLVSSKQL